MKKYYTTDKKGDIVEVDKETALELINMGKKTIDDFEIEEIEDTPKVPTKSSKAIASNLRDTAKEIQDEYDRSNDIFPGEVITDPTQGIAGDIYDVGS